ncbi:MAG: transposase zinc-binding domain-containing protein [Planctomycetota bacterium]
MPTVGDALRKHGDDYLKLHGESNVPAGHRKVLSLVQRCRTGRLGGVQWQCNDCGYEHWVGRSCGNRHCPT